MERMVKLQTAKLEIKNKARNLGVVLDSDLNLNSHIKTVVKSPVIT